MEKTAVRYYSRTGNTKKVAESIAEAAGTTAVSTDAPDAELHEPVDVLFIGGALYAYGLDKHLRDYLDTLSAANVKKAIVFSTSWISRHAIDLIRKALESKGIRVEKDVLYFKSNRVKGCDSEVRAFVKQHI